MEFITKKMFSDIVYNASYLRIYTDAEAFEQVLNLLYLASTRGSLYCDESYNLQYVTNRQIEDYEHSRAYAFAKVPEENTRFANPHSNLVELIEEEEQTVRMILKEVNRALDMLEERQIFIYTYIYKYAKRKVFDMMCISRRRYYYLLEGIVWKVKKGLVLFPINYLD